MKTFREYLEEAKMVGIYPHGEGSDVHEDDDKPDIVSHATDKAIGNEPGKDKTYFRKPNMKKYVGKMRRQYAKKQEMPPVTGTPHPANPEHMSIVDGNHRLRSAKNARVKNVSVEKVSHDNIHLMSQSYNDTPESDDNIQNKITKNGHPLSSFRNKDGSYDMEKPRKRLGGRALKHYFTPPK
jgi:hypothetical protein